VLSPLTKDYRNYIIKKNIETFGPKWDFAHKDYDGPEDRRTGTGASCQECKDEIDEQLLELDEDEDDGQPSEYED
jgi:hypothetical protein